MGYEQSGMSLAGREEKSRLIVRRTRLRSDIKWLENGRGTGLTMESMLKNFLLPYRGNFEWRVLVHAGFWWFVMAVATTVAFFVPAEYATWIVAFVVVGFISSRSYTACECCEQDGLKLISHSFAMILLLPVLWIIRLLQARIHYVERLRRKRLEELEQCLSRVDYELWRYEEAMKLPYRSAAETERSAFPLATLNC